ncbi:NUDIX domain-containing protein [Sphingomonas soli]|uniref:NUDIX domain-containing protein n=1 Tax=Sphingomonas soli TaxID=266127 RepID=UPI000834CF8B|nr:NUDIX domain-containing protein [Sphingomonas soli]
MTREDGIHRIEAHVSGVCISSEGHDRVLLGKRADWRQLFPSHWECGGGQVLLNQSFDEAVRAHLHDEFGLTIGTVQPFCTYAIQLSDGGVIPGLRFVCPISPEAQVTIDNRQIVEFAWVPLEKLPDYRTIPGLAEEILEGARVLRASGSRV